MTTTSTSTTATFAHLMIALDRAMQRAAALALELGATEDEADEAAKTALRQHLATLS